MINVLINSTVLSNFAAVERLPLLPALYGNVYLTQAVYAEAQQGLEDGYAFLEGLDACIFPFHLDGWLHLITIEGEEEWRLYQQAPPKLHRGEAMSLAIAAHRGWKFLSDDQAARRYAITLGVEVSGTLGVLVQLVKRDLLLLAEANDVLVQMGIHARYTPPVTDLAVLFT